MDEMKGGCHRLAWDVGRTTATFSVWSTLSCLSTNVRTSDQPRRWW